MNLSRSFPERKNVKIAQIAPIWISIPPHGYGGAEVIISALADELVDRGHDVTLFASGDSTSKAKLYSVMEKAPGLTQSTMLDAGFNMKHLYNYFMALEKSSEFDLIHWHLSKDISPIMFAPLIKTPSLITIHNHFGGDDVKEIIEHYKDVKYFASISNSHRKQFPFEFIDTVYNGIDVNQYDFNDQPENYLVWIGRFVKMKGPDLAIKVALKMKMPLKLAAPIDEGDYFKKEIEPYLGKDGIEYVGEVGPKEKNELLRKAVAFVNPIQWEEPFGLVVPESNACGTPIVAFDRGSMPEIIQDNINGFCVKADDLDAMAETLQKIVDMPKEEYLEFRKSCRKFAQEKFTIAKMVDGYESVYQKIINSD